MQLCYIVVIAVLCIAKQFFSIPNYGWTLSMLELGNLSKEGAMTLPFRKFPRTFPFSCIFLAISLPQFILGIIVAFIVSG